MLVFVQYEIDSTTEVVEHATVEDVHPKNVADFDGSHIYDVWWSGNENVCGGYYKAKVLHITESRIIYATSMNVVVGGRSSCAKPLIGQYRSKRIQRDHCIQYYIPYRISVAWVQAVQ
ncbi:hypothetical protein MRX96_056964 [Rhipicephalus microplus]